MKTSLQWLRTYLPEAPDALLCGDKLTLAGLPTETFEKYEGDDVFDVEVTSNRSDCLSHVGIARELGALLKLAVNEPPIDPPSGALVKGNGAKVRVEDAAGCYVYTARVIRGVKVGASPVWMQRHLLALGLRPINNVVDITNFVMLEMGQPLHAFDLLRLSGAGGGEAEIVVRRARAGEELISLDGHTRKLDPTMLVIADGEKPAALAGIMGGKISEVTEGTTDILLESAIFDPLTVRKTSRQLGLRSDSSYRYERGIDPTLPRRASLRAARLILELAGGKLEDVEAVVGRAEPVAKKLTLRMAKLSKVLGYEISAEAAVDALERLRMRPVLEGETIRVTVPADRLDINIEVDLVEEVARVTGYEHIPQREMIEIRLTPPDLTARSLGIVNDTVVGAGYFEAITFSFVSDGLAGDFVPAGAAGLPRAEAATRKADARLRPSLLPGLLEALRRNEASGNGAVKLFEVGSTFVLGAGGAGAGGIVETRRVAIVGGEDLNATRGVVEALLGRLDARLPVVVRAGVVAGYDAAGVVEWGGQRVGTVGVIAKSVVGKLDLRHSPCAAELDLAPLIEKTRHVPQLTPLPKYPGVERDVSLVVKEEVAYDALLSLVRGLALADLESTSHVTTYRGKPLEKGTKSISMRLLFRSAERSLKAEEADGSVGRFVEAAKAELGAVLRV